MSEKNLLKQKIHEDLKTALKQGEELKLSALRLLMSAITNKEIELRKKDVGLSDEEVVSVLRSEVKKRKDAADEFRRGEREELARKEGEEARILQEYLPAEVEDSEIERVVEMSARETNAQTMADFGKVMKSAMAVLKGKASGDRVSAIVLKKLESRKLT